MPRKKPTLRFRMVAFADWSLGVLEIGDIVYLPYSQTPSSDSNGRRGASGAAVAEPFCQPSEFPCKMVGTRWVKNADAPILAHDAQGDDGVARTRRTAFGARLGQAVESAAGLRSSLVVSHSAFRLQASTSATCLFEVDARSLKTAKEGRVQHEKQA